MSEIVKIFTNEVRPAWEADDIDNFLGGSEESIVFLSEALVRRGYDVAVYHSKRVQEQTVRNGVKYLPREKTKCDNVDIFITWKDRNPWLTGAKGKLNIHWTADVEQAWGFDEQSQILNIYKLDKFVNISNYLKRRNFFVPITKEYAVPLGVDIESLEQNKREKEPDTALYCSSPDRGLMTLLQAWSNIKRHYPALKLKVAYGWNNFNFQNFQLRQFRNQIDALLKQPDIEYCGALTKQEIEQEYWKAQYWLLPLNNPDSELFCLNAVKARYCGCMPIVNKVGALKETVGDYIPFANFMQGKNEVVKQPAVFDAMSWDDVVDKYWISEIFNMK